MSCEETMMRWATVLLASCTGMLLMFGCSELQDKQPTMVQALEREACETCHAMPPQDEIHYEHVIDATVDDSTLEVLLPLKCRDCHKGYDDNLGWVDATMHRNGISDTLAEQCDYCHLVRWDCTFCHATPPVVTPQQQKAHRHYTEDSIACGVCHKGYDLDKKIAPRATHNNGTINVIFDAPQKIGKPTAPTYQDGACYNLYCHGAVTPGGKQVVALTDVQQSGKLQCDFCHATTQLYQQVPVHAEHDRAGVYDDCLNCHSDFSYNDTLADSKTHFNGKIDTLITKCLPCHDPVPPLQP
jgi:hypothetical protein